MKTCQNCGNGVPDSAARCHWCNQPFEKVEPSRTGFAGSKVGIWGAVVLAVLFVIMAVLDVRQEEPASALIGGLSLLIFVVALVAASLLLRSAGRSMIESAGGGFLIGVGAVALAALAFFPKPPQPPPAPPPEPANIAAVVRFDGVTFTVINNDPFPWTDVELQVNPGLLRAGFRLSAARIEAGRSYTVGALQFAKPAGERFDPTRYKAQTFSISCMTPRGRAFYSATWTQ